MSDTHDHLRSEKEPASQAVSVQAEDAGARALADALKSSFFFVKILMLILIVVFLASGVFTVKPNQVAVILRFGKPVGEGSGQLLKPGIHLAFPEPIDEIVTIPVGESHTVTSSVGWYATTTEMEKANIEPQLKGTLTPGFDGYTLTADGNIIHVRATLKYRISDPWRYAFHFASATNLIQNLLNNAVNYASTRYAADVALYKDTTGFRDLIRDRMAQAIERYQLGIELEPLSVQSIAPLDVRAAFVAVQEAEQTRSKTINEAEAAARDVVLRAEGEAKSRLNDGITWSNQLVKSIGAEERFFTNQLASFERQPDLFKKRLLVEALQRSLPKDQDKFIVLQRADGQPRELRIQLNPEPLSATNNSAR